MKLHSKHRKKQPEWLIVYWCPRCLLDSGTTEVDGPFCFSCDRKEGLLEMSREPLTREALSKRMQTSADRMIENLLGAHGISKEEWPKDDKIELLLLEALSKGEDLKEKIRELNGV